MAAGHVALPGVVHGAAAPAGLALQTAGTSLRTGGSTAQAAFLSGGVAGCVAKTATAPLSRLTVLAQTSTLLAAGAGSGPGMQRGAVLSNGIWGGLRQIWQREGFLSLWRGNMLTCVHRFPYTGVNFGVNEVCWLWAPETCRALPFIPGALAGGFGVVLCYPLELMALMATVPSVSISFMTYRRLKEELPSFCRSTLRREPGPQITVLVAGALAGIAGSTLTFPLDVLRRRLQVMGMDPAVPQRTCWQEALHIWRTEGHRGFLRGLQPEIIKTAPAVAISFATFEAMRKVLQRAR